MKQLARARLWPASKLHEQPLARRLEELEKLELENPVDWELGCAGRGEDCVLYHTNLYGTAVSLRMDAGAVRGKIAEVEYAAHQ